jgi:hypothetical protein
VLDKTLGILLVAVSMSAVWAWFSTLTAVVRAFLARPPDTDWAEWFFAGFSWSFARSGNPHRDRVVRSLLLFAALIGLAILILVVRSFLVCGTFTCSAAVRVSP